MNIGFITLGCDKNTVDSERYLAQLADHGARHTTELERADVIVINTCGFIDAAKQESIDAIVEAGRLKRLGNCRTLVAVGCMVERHKAELAAELPEVDLFLGASEMDRLVPALRERGVLQDPVWREADHPGVRLYTGDVPHVRYLKISEGCDHGCAFCAIPLMRGTHRSFALDDVVREAQVLELQGAREINLVAQDLAHFGRDRRDGTGLPELLEALVDATSIPWIRMLYVYSAGITTRLLDLMARERRIVPYLDIPIQHGSDAVLARMRRPERADTIRACVARLRDAVPDVAVRTTCIVGFPGETDDDFQQLCDLLEEVRFDRVGAFTYSAQEGTRAAALADDVPASLKLERLDRLTDIQRAVGAERAERYVGRTVPAIVDRAAAPGERAEGRLWWQADDIDGVTYLEGDATPGSIIECVVESVETDDDFTARVARVTVPAGSASAARPRALPVLSGIAQG
ncbi:MAG TPA: 30S ribosomal protein S12 methylthiotransferase RimO, partial [Vicinamibacterales bacterium]|nr:30S ribosomal protein S12 methylthiotransferase RimO [Vicinamibacterales bacterium]